MPINFRSINDAAMADLPSQLCRWLPGGKTIGNEYVVRNPIRADHRPGSFKINLHTGKWADFASGDAGGDVISLYAYLHGLKQSVAARELAKALGMRHGK